MQPPSEASPSSASPPESFVLESPLLESELLESPPPESWVLESAALESCALESSPPPVSLLASLPPPPAPLLLLLHAGSRQKTHITATCFIEASSLEALTGSPGPSKRGYGRAGSRLLTGGYFFSETGSELARIPP